MPHNCAGPVPGGRAGLLGLAGLALAAALSGFDAAAQAAPPALQEADQTLFLIGDAGKPAQGGDPVLVALRRDLASRRERATVVFLGDNIYPSGLPAEGRPEHDEALRRLDDQIDVGRDTGARMIFVPGNHDWRGKGAEGRESVKRQQRRIEQRGGPTAGHLPKGGCPGPEVVDVGARLRLVALDTQWWLQPHTGDDAPAAACASGSEAEVIASLQGALRVAERDVVVVTHHPPLSGGPHGGHFGLRQHLFPLTDSVSWLWLPLPGIGSAYPLLRQTGRFSQDISSASYSKMRDAIASTFRGSPPLAWAAGHEHVLQVIEDSRFGRVLVSGAGVYNHTSRVKQVRGSRFGSSRSGYMRIDLFSDGRRRLTVIEVARDSTTREAYASDIAAILPDRPPRP